MKLKLKHLSPYLPYRLKCEVNKLSQTEIREATGCKLNHLSYINKFVYKVYFGVYGYEFKYIKPILRPLSDLTKDDFEYLNQKLLKKDKFGIGDKGQLVAFGCVGLKLKSINNYFQYLFKNHYDVFGLIEKDLAIDINLLKQ